ncbi:MAG: PAP2 family protein [Candidatus Amesbacteria bacterium GW2011_GWA1_47_16]|uniref:Phosphatidic acid phosphatase type 2/haloperoxidase domain-containing protein n=5 Tax=Candidatus Amesiibacteriota TaxID=1752730 RepID=A0A1F5A0C7_9BACT|nr:MAG: PAP2 family protein [Candidatus Amesbacteria bacterium GW2011_GWA1_47_16]KKU63530.1 MAG: PAP2 family protein [Candidatus Amesbacteria bacterium GW2011_GWC1_47_15]KKU97725.1 MAG: PAP2 family protein [Candidatus Amesbacteria bacterium GW2011_GWB1_48_13]OGC98063.1 MAG: hypothetical protein A2701_00330 [Candidatus Amesbacteria bacterium RIFCSPHIGHO2_01_FULL_47_34]OGC99594.1 MAG: hypothetical protein A2972_02440 [Candidatus Amesbacteria bacterium RIFCSPLOWO2_01_FULL_47_33]OGD11317.1 MAG: hy
MFSDRLISFVADYLIFIFPVMLAAIWFAGYRKAFYHMVLSAGFVWILSSLIKDFFYFPRPYIVDARIPAARFFLDGSFPSGHTAVAFALSFSLFIYHRSLGLALLALSCIIAFGRVLGGVHSFLDVSGGILLGLFTAYIAQIPLDTYHSKC